jgi:hypothetical protein
LELCTPYLFREQELPLGECREAGYRLKAALAVKPQ